MTQSAINTALAGKVSSFTATASVDAEVGTPSVTVTKSGTTTDPSYAFAFKNLKGATGATGPQGPQGPTGPQGPQGEKGATGAAGSNNIVMVQSSQPTDPYCKIWIKP